MRLVIALAVGGALFLAPATVHAAQLPGPPVTVPTSVGVQASPAPSPTPAPDPGPGVNSGMGIGGMEQWVGAAGPWLGNQLQLALGSSPGSDWYAGVFAVFARLALAFLPLFYVLALLVSVIRGDAWMAVKSALVWTPGAVLGTVCVIWAMTQALQLTDGVCRYLLDQLGQNLTGLLTHTGTAMVGAFAAGTVLTGGGADVVAFAGALAFVIAGVVILLELAMRLAGIYIAGCFLPLTLAAAVWPAARHLLRIHLEAMAGLVLVKVFVLGCLVIGAFAFTASPLSTAPGGEPGMADIAMGAMVLVIACLSPFTLLKILPWTAGQITADLGRRTAGAASSHWQRAGHARQMIVDRLQTRHRPPPEKALLTAVKGGAKANVVLTGATVVVRSASNVPLAAGPPESRVRTVRKPPSATTRTAASRRSK